MSMFVRDDGFEVLSGQTVRYDRKADTGNVIAMNFCTRHELLHALPCAGSKRRTTASDPRSLSGTRRRHRPAAP